MPDSKPTLPLKMHYETGADDKRVRVEFHGDDVVSIECRDGARDVCWTDVEGALLIAWMILDHMIAKEPEHKRLVDTTMRMLVIRSASHA